MALLTLCLGTGAAKADVVAKVDLSSQRMNVYVNGASKYSWPVSTARRGYRTPVGTFRPQSLRRMHYSKKYHNSPMPHSIFFLGGYAIHGTGAVKSLGRPASHGCVRLHPANAATLFSLVQDHGRGNTRIVITR
ncbi:MAG: L,D-transpeptidase [Hyphomicrobiales bacterium]